MSFRSHLLFANADPQSFSMGPALVGTKVYGPKPYTIPGTVIPTITAHIMESTDLVNPVVDLDQSKDRRWLEVSDDAGSASLVLSNLDPDLTDLTPGRLIQFRYHGWAAFTMLARNADRIIRDQGEEANQLTTISGPGHIARLDRSTVMPSRGVGVRPVQTDRSFGWAAPEYNDDAWGVAFQVAAQDNPGLAWRDPSNNPLPSGWPAGSGAYWIWDISGAPNGFDEWAPEGSCYFRHEITLADPCKLFILLTADDRATLYIDGMAVVDTDNGNAAPTELHTVTVECTAGLHTIAVVGTNAPDDPAFPGTNNPAGILVAGYVINQFGFISNPPEFVTDNSWKVLPYPPSAPGMRLGEVLRIVLDEWETAGTAPTIARTFSDELDSNGNPWPIEQDITTKVGNDGFMFVCRELGGTYIDVHMQPASWTMDAYRIGERGRATTASMNSATDPADPTTGNLLSLSVRDDLEPITSFLVRWAENWVVVEDAAAIATYGRNRVVLGLSALSESEAIRIATEQLAIFARLRSEITAEVRDGDEADWPYVSYQICDTVLVDQDTAGTQAPEKVLSISVSEDELGTVSVVPTLRDLMREALARHERALKKSGLGTVDGRSDVANPVSQIISNPPSCCPPTVSGGGG